MRKPIRFIPILQPTIWGGAVIARSKGLDEEQYNNIGESWEICDLKSAATVVAEGEEQGKTLRQLIQKYGADLLGKKNFEQYGDTFPLLIKFIDSAADLSIQVHPNDAMAQRQEGRPFGKSEMWYIVAAEKGAKITNGFSEDIPVEEQKALLSDRTLTKKLNVYDSHAGDCYYIPAGRIHAIGAGNFIIEIQQACDITYRVYDYERLDKTGKPRELHTDLALEAMCFQQENNCQTSYNLMLNAPIPLLATPYFVTNLYHLTTERYVLDNHGVDSFRVLIAFEGRAEIVADDSKTTLEAGHSLFLPAALSEVTILKYTDKFSFLETYID